jgi:hypothetical protein
MAINTYTELRQTVVGTATNSVTLDLTGISGYTDLELVADYTASAASNILGRFNGDTGSNYSWTYLDGNGTTAASGRGANQTLMNFGYSFGADNRNNAIIKFMNYANTTTNKTVINRQNQPAGYVSSTVNLWRNTNAVTSIEIFTNAGNFAVGSTFSLYGIKVWADETTPKATGGYVYSDSTYWYHAFPFSSTFTPNQTISCDYLVLAGGGGGGDNIGGGGGAGGYRTATSQSLTATGYTVTVGAGGFGASGSASSFNGLATTGGGKGGGANSNGSSGGSGGGGGGAAIGAGGAGNSGSYSPVEGFAGGNGNQGSGANRSGGGGGATAAGQNFQSTASGAGGTGTSALSSWLAVTSIGENVSGTYYIAGGGGGGNQGTNINGVGGLGGGGLGGNNRNGFPGIVSTGAGGGGGGNDLTNGFSGAPGGSGVVIVRYAK